MLTALPWFGGVCAYGMESNGGLMQICTGPSSFRSRRIKAVQSGFDGHARLRFLHWGADTAWQGPPDLV
ncbi:hypothetical protein ABAC402_06045 [Asticcacaulis sp. AC402]|nr:hypothetical protein ABAC402_06045 [Asticcacaulis sp. AC402]